MTASVFTQSRFQHRDMSGINITPLVDVLLVLLIIFMMASLPRPQSLDLNVSRAVDRTTPPPPRTLMSVGVDGRISLEGASIAPSDLPAELTALKARSPETLLALETSEGADYGVFARVLADTRNAGFADVALRP